MIFNFFSFVVVKPKNEAIFVVFAVKGCPGPAAPGSSAYRNLLCQPIFQVGVCVECGSGAVSGEKIIKSHDHKVIVQFRFIFTALNIKKLSLFRDNKCLYRFEV